MNLKLNLLSVIRKGANEIRFYIFAIDLFSITEAVLSRPDKLPVNMLHFYRLHINIYIGFLGH